jgi:hypothetical protein
MSSPGSRLGPETTSTLKRALQFYLEYEPEFIATFFPRIAERNHVTMTDVADLTPRQADALRPLLADSVRYFRRTEEKQAARASPPPGGTARPPAPSSETLRKAQWWADALGELCESFGLSNPLQGDP